MKKIFTATGILLLVPVWLFAQPEFVTNISSTGGEFGSFNGQLVFTANNSLWKSDGTAPGTVLIADGLDTPGKIDTLDNFFYFLNSRFGEFWAYRWRELWISDGTPAGTFLLKSADTEEIRIVASSGNLLYFTVNTTAEGRELWRTDGTPAGTILLKNIGPGAASGVTLTFGEFIGAELHFAANDGIHGKELWKTDGTTARTVMVKDINPGAADGVKQRDNGGYSADATGGHLFFYGDDGTNGAELWKSDGTGVGTAMVKNINPSSEDSYSDIGDNQATYYEVSSLMVGIDGTIFFAPISSYDGGDENVHLWKSDGTEEGTEEVKMVPAQFFSNTFNLNGKLIFETYMGIDYELWVSNGTEAGTERLKGNLRRGDNYLGDFTMVGDYLVFTDNIQNYEYQLWKTDGSPSGTELIREMYSQPGDMEALGNRLFYTEHGAETEYESGDGVNDFELWQSDLTTEGTFMVKTISEDSSFSFSDNLTAVDAQLYFTRGGTSYGSPSPPQLWKYYPDDFAVSGFTLVDSDTDTDLKSLAEGDTVFTSQSVNIRADVFGMPGSLRFLINDRGVRTENAAPFSLAGDNSGNYNEWMKEEGVYKITARPFEGPSASGASGSPFSINIVVMSPQDTLHSVTGLTLVDANTNADIKTLEDGDTIYTNQQVNVRADVSGGVASVNFRINGKGVRTENAAPFSLAGDNSGDYNEWAIAAGAYTLTAVPFSATQAGGEAGNSFTVNISVVATESSSSRVAESAADNNPFFELNVYPNPVADQLSVGQFSRDNKISEVYIYDLAGNIYYHEVFTEGTTKDLRVDLNDLGMAPGFYVLKVKATGNQEKIVKLIKN